MTDSNEQTEVNAVGARALVGGPVIIAAYTGAVFIGAGVAYNHAYNAVFRSSVRSTTALADAAIGFSISVLRDGVYLPLFLAVCLAFILAVALIYAGKQNLGLRILGYVTLTFVMLGTFFGCIWFGDVRGTRAAHRDSSIETTTLPAIKLYVDGQNARNDDSEYADFDSGDFHLLSLTDDRLLIFVPSETPDTSVTVTAINRADIVRYEIETH